MQGGVSDIPIRQFMNWQHLGISVLLVGALTAAFYFERYRHKQKILRRLRDGYLRLEDIRPKPRNWYRFRAGLTLFVLVLASYPLMRWLFSDASLFRIETLFDGMVFGGLALLGAVFYGQWLGDLWFDTVDAAYREVKAQEESS